MRHAKGRRALLLGLAILGPALMVPGCARHDPPQAGSADSARGPKPDPKLLFLAITLAKGRGDQAPETCEALVIGAPVPDEGDTGPCWRVPFTYEARAAFGGKVDHHGTFWVRNGKVIRKQWG